MPFYDYECPNCGKIEIEHKITEDAVRACPNCAKKGIEAALKRLISLSSFQLKGKGWYKTDYNKKSS